MYRLKCASGALAIIVAGCSTNAEPRAVTITGTDYAFVVPGTLEAGPTLLTLENPGTVDHEMALARLRPGVTLAAALEAMEAGADDDEFLEQPVGVLFAAPGEVSGGQLLVDLVSGATYALICFLRDSPDDPPHLALGMVATLSVP